MWNQLYETVVGVPNRLFAKNAPSPIRWVGEEQGGGVALCTGQMSYGCVYSDHVICGCDGACRFHKVFELASGVLDVGQASSLIYFGSKGCCNGFEMGSQPVEFSSGISTHLQADPIGTLERQVLGEFHDRKRSTVVVFVLGVASPGESNTPAVGGAVTSSRR